MKKIILAVVLLLVLVACNSESAPDCFQVEGKIVERSIETETFKEITVHKGIKLFLRQGDSIKIKLQTGKNLIPDISFDVDHKRLHITNHNQCHAVRGYGLTKVEITLPELTYLRNAGQFSIVGLNVLKFNSLTLVSENNSNPDFYTNGDFKMNIKTENLTIVNNGVSDYFISGQVNQLNIGFYNGDGRFEGGNLRANSIEVYHRGSNKIIVDPQGSLTGKILSTGDVIAKNRPPEVDVEHHYTGKLIFEN